MEHSVQVSENTRIVYVYDDEGNIMDEYEEYV